MSATRRILAAGLPAAAALIFAASPALAMADHAVRPAVTASPCDSADRAKCDYGTTGAGTSTGTAGAPGTAGTPGGGQHTRGHGGYGTTPATTSPSTPVTTRSTSPAPSGTSPSAHVNTTPATSPTSPAATPSAPAVQGVTPAPSASTGGGVSAGHSLPVTGAPMGAIITLGGLMVAAGVASVWYTRRRRTV